MSLLTTFAAKLPADPNEALYEFAKRVRDQYERFHLNARPEDYSDALKFIYSFADRFGIEINWPDVLDGSREKPDSVLLLDVAREVTMQLHDRGVGSEVYEVLSEYEATQAEETFGIARLNPTEKQKIHEHISAIRKVIESSPLSDRKKNALFARLNELANEVDKHGTRTDNFFAFLGDLAFTVGDMAGKAQPAIKEVREMLKIVYRARARQENISLPSGDEPLQLSPPDSESDE